MAKRKVGAVGLGGMSVFLSVDHFHAPGETVHAESIYSEFGGKAYNQAVAARRLGSEVSFFGAVGNDDNGSMCKQALIKEGIKPCLQICNGLATAYACILTDKAGENRVTVFAGATAVLSEEFIRSQESEIASCSVLLLGLECPIGATLAALEIAQLHGIYTIFNPAPAKSIPLELLKRFDLLTPNAQETAVLFGLEHPASKEAICDALAGFEIKNAVVTLGGEGALLWDGVKGKAFDAIPTVAIDTTGAGDCFNGALAAAICNGWSMEDAVHFAIKASSRSVAVQYVMPSLPSIEELL